MLEIAKITRLATLLAEARRAGRRLTTLPPDLVPLDAAEADAVQWATAERLGEAIAGYKVAQVGDAGGSLGLIAAPRLLASPARATLPATGMRIELEIAFRVGRNLPGRADGRPYGADEVAAALDSAFAAFEVVESRLPAEPKPAPLAARADSLSNWGLVIGTPVADWRPAVRADVGVVLTIDGARVVDRVGGHPAGDPLHPVVWLANALAARGRGLAAGQVVTTGAFGGSHPLPAGAHVTGTIAGFDPITLEVLA